MKNYEQRCGLALALDRLGDRWTLLVVRELLAGPMRYSDLKLRLPGISPNLLSDRIRRLGDSGLLEVRAQSAVGGATHYALTSAGEELRRIINPMVRWGGQFLRDTPQHYSAQPHWLMVALPALCEQRQIDATLGIELSVEDFTFSLSLTPEGPAAQPPSPADPDVRIHGSYGAVLAAFSGSIGFEQAQKAMGLVVDGTADAKRRLHQYLAD